MVKYSRLCILVALILVLGSVVKCDKENNGTDNEDNPDLLLTAKQKSILDQFKKLVSDRLPHDYMKEDVYLVRWLRATQFDMKRAEEALMNNMKWREEYKMDGIQDEDFSDITHDHPVDIDTFTKSGRPVITAIAGQWDLRQAVLTGRNKRTTRFVYQLIDKAARMVREAQQAGKDVTRFDFILSLDGFNLAQHGCPRCIIDIMGVIRQAANYYPEIYDRITVLNTPAYIRGIFEPLIRAAISQSSIDSINLKLLGTDRNEWRRYFLQYIDEDQLPEEFGGTRVRNP